MNETDPGALPQWQHATCPDDVSGYTPTTDEIRNVWGEFSEYGGLTNRTSGGSLIDARYAEFDRWLATHDRDIQAQALREAADYRGPADEAAHFTPEARNLLRSLADLIYEMGASADDEKESRNAEEGNHRPDRMRAARLTETTEETNDD